MNKDCDIYKAITWGLTIVCVVLAGIIYIQHNHINYLEELLKGYME